MNELALFAGAGGGILGAKLLGWRTVCAVEIDRYCREVLLRRQRDGVLPLFPVWDDIRTFDGTAWRGAVDIVTAGFPCQPFSIAGKQLGEKDERNLWPETIRIIREVGAPLALLENVPALLANEYYGTILGDLAESGLDVEWCLRSAASAGAPHFRNRLWILGERRGNPTERKVDFVADARCLVEQYADKLARTENPTGAGSSGAEVADDDRPRLANIQGKRPAAWSPRRPLVDAEGWWDAEPDVGRLANGVANRVDRLKALGNGQVPAVVATVWRSLREYF